MRKYLIYSTLATTGIIAIFIIYLSIYGLKTERFNTLIIDRIKTIDSKLSLDIDEVFLKLDLKEKSVNISTINANLYLDKEFINLSRIDLNLNILKFLKKENSIKTIKISTKKNKIKKITNFLNVYKFSLPRLIIYKQIEDGFLEATLDINFNENNESKIAYNLLGKITEGKVNVLNNTKIEDINFNFIIRDNKYIFKKTSFNYKGVDFNSEEILVEKLEDEYEVKGTLLNKKGLIDLNYFSNFVNFDLNFLENKNVLIDSNNKFKFKINSKKKIKNFELISKINFKEIFINKKIQNLIFLKNGNIYSEYKQNDLEVIIDSGYAFLKDNYKNSEKDNIKIKIVKKKNQDFKVEAYVNNENNSINSGEFSNYFKNSNKIIKDQDITFGSTNEITFTINKKNKVKDLKLKSMLNLKKIIINYKSTRLNKIFPNYENIVKIKSNLIDIDFSKNKTRIFIDGNYSFNNRYDTFNSEILKNKNDIIFNSRVQVVANPIAFDDINYKKEKNIFSEISINAKLLENKIIKFKEIILLENKNIFSLSNLYLSNDYKIIDLDKLELNYLNESKKLNQVSITKNDKKFKLNSLNFDGKYFVKNLIKGSSTKNNILKRFKNFNSEIILNFNEFLIDDKNYLKNIRGNIVIEKNKIKYGNISAKINNQHDFNLNIKTNSKNDKITNLIIDNPEPFMKHYKFIKGFDEGKLSYNSVEKDGFSKSKLNIYDFKVKKVPVLAKILTLASLQGIADVLTGEGIRFNDFEMDYETQRNLTEIKEMYAIGPAISILMSGFIEKEKSISLRGTLVPATTVNKTIAKIPLIGDLLVGKKTGEGVFGVSFKIKGPPKDLKTTVNPVKTLTPRFITRTLEKLK